MKAFQQGLIFVDGKKRKQLSQEAADLRMADSKRQKAYLKDLEKRSLIPFSFNFGSTESTSFSRDIRWSKPWLGPLQGDAAVEGPSQGLPEFKSMRVLLPTHLSTEKLRRAVHDCGAKLTAAACLG